MKEQFEMAVKLSYELNIYYNNFLEKENEINLKRLSDLLFSIIDLFSFSLIILPLYPKTVNHFVYSVNLFHYTETTTLNLNMSDNPPKLTAVRNSSGKINSVYANNVLSVPNVNENIEIEAAYQTENTYYYVGGEQTFTTPHNGIYKIELWGAQGGYETVDPEYYPGAYGGYVSGEINLNKNKEE